MNYKLTAITIVCSIAVGFAVSFLLGFVLIPFLKRLKFGQTIYTEGPAWHKSKQGTPTMGGFMFIIGTAVSLTGALCADVLLRGGMLESSPGGDPGFVKKKFFAGLIMACAYGIVGFLDDYIKVVKKRNMGLTIKQKSLMEIVVIAVYLGTLYVSGCDFMFIPFVGSVHIGLWFFPIGAVAVYCTVNAVNFTDGVDGLCASVTAVAAAFFGVTAFVRHYLGVSLLAAALFGALAGYFVWNRHPAKVMMGDTGSLFLGGLVVAMAYCLDAVWLILLIGIIYVIEFASDVLQISYYKLTHGKRIFKMAPIHHHFEKCGWSEKKINVVFDIVGALGGAAALALVYFGSPK